MSTLLEVDEKTDYAFHNAEASLEIEGQALTEGGEELILLTIWGEIFEEEFLKRALEMAIGA